jgi:hypothetical protein
MPDVSLLIQSGYTPRREWIERHFRVELEEKSKKEEEAESTTFDPQQDQDLFGSIFGGDAQPTQGQQQAAATDLEAAAGEMASPPGATPEESQADAISSPSAEELTNELVGDTGETTPQEMEVDQELADLWDNEPEESIGEDDEEEAPKKPFGNQGITEDEAVEMDRK